MINHLLSQHHTSSSTTVYDPTCVPAPSTWTGDRPVLTCCESFIDRIVQCHGSMLVTDRVPDPLIASKAILTSSSCPRIYTGRNVEQEIIVYQFSRLKVERGDFSHFLGEFAPEKLPTGRRLREMMNSIAFCIGGYDHDPREIYTIPEIRNFYSAFHAAWPYWLYFCNLDQDALKTMVFCCIPSFTALKVDRTPNCLVEADPMEVLKFISTDFSRMNAICERAGMFEHLIDGRTRAIFEYFGMPYASGEGS